jgi:hypothetical protein
MLLRLVPSFLLFLLLLTSCDFPAPQVAATVEWPELRSLETIAAEVAAHARDRSDLELMKDRTRLVQAGWAVNPASVPENVANFTEVKALLSDLVSLVNGLAVPEAEPTRFRELALGIPSVVEKLVEASGAR